LIDLSQEAARQLGFERDGLAQVRVQFVRLADAKGEPPQPTARRARAAVPQRPAVPAPQLVATAPVQEPMSERPAAPAPQLVAAAPAQCQGRFIQVGAFAEPVRARRVMAELHALQAMPVRLAMPAQDHLARVRLGPLADPTTVDATLDRLKGFGFSEAFVVAPDEDPPTDC
jgi:rare lipoprotein A